MTKLNKIAITKSDVFEKLKRKRKWRWITRIKNKIILKILILKDKYYE